jgi:hypothetical protein
MKEGRWWSVEADAKAPNSKRQAPEKFQVPESQNLRLGPLISRHRAFEAGCERLKTNSD